MKEKIPYQVPKIKIEVVKFDFLIGKTILSYDLKQVYCTIGHIRYDCKVCVEFENNNLTTLEMFSFARFVDGIRVAAVEEIPQIIYKEIIKIITPFNLKITVSLGDINHGGIVYIKDFR